MFQEFFRQGRCSQGNVGESWDQVRQAEAPIETVFEFGQVALRIFRLKRVIAAAKCGFQIPQHRIDPVKLGFFHRRTTAAADDRLMSAACLCHRIKTSQTVRVRHHVGY